MGREGGKGVKGSSELSELTMIELTLALVQF